MCRAQVVVATLFALVVSCFFVEPLEANAGHYRDDLPRQQNAFFDHKEKLWKRWSCREADQRIIIFAESKDGRQWQEQQAPAFSANSEFDAWDSFSVGQPKVVHNASNPRNKRYVLFYYGAAEGSAGIAASLAARGLGVAYSSDGRSFRRLKSGESPYGQDGLVLSLAPVYADKGRSRSFFSSPQVAFSNSSYELWYSIMSVDGEGKVASAGISHATSADGITWKMDSENQLTVHIGNQNPSREKLSRRLNRLSVAFREAASM
jgi:hypothetical protein